MQDKHSTITNKVKFVVISSRDEQHWIPTQHIHTMASDKNWTIHKVMMSEPQESSGGQWAILVVGWVTRKHNLTTSTYMLLWCMLVRFMWAYVSEWMCVCIQLCVCVVCYCASVLWVKNYMSIWCISETSSSWSNKCVWMYISVWVLCVQFVYI